MAGNNRKNRRLKDLEYNVYNSNPDGNNTETNNNSGCITLLAGLAITVIVCFVIMCAMQVGRNGPSLTCATAGCNNRVKTGSTYCWLHSPKSTKTRRQNTNSGGSIFDSEPEKTPVPENPKRRKIFSGVEGSTNNSDGKGSSDGGQNGTIGQ